MLEITLLRQRHTRARTATESPIEGADTQMAAHILDFFNGDWTKGFIEHYCWRDSCCNFGQIEFAISICIFLLSAILLDKVGEDVPSTHRWHTAAPSLETQAWGTIVPASVSHCSVCEANFCLACLGGCPGRFRSLVLTLNVCAVLPQALGIMLHNILGRLSETASNQANAAATLNFASAEVGDDTSTAAFQEYRARKDVKSQRFLGSAEVRSNNRRRLPSRSHPATPPGRT